MRGTMYLISYLILKSRISVRRESGWEESMMEEIGCGKRRKRRFLEKVNWRPGSRIPSK